mgnify:CR=1 FL=1
MKNYSNLFKAFIITCFLIFFVSCSKEDGVIDEEAKTLTFNVNGRVEKGPFVSGSQITLQPMDKNMNPLGSTFSTNITDNSGSFSFGSKEFDAPYAQMTANGYFFNEITGELSKGTLSLRAIVNLSDASSVNVNILTHLKYQRIVNLIKSGKSFEVANKQAQEELLTAFGLQRFLNKDVSQYSITAGTDEAGALIAISSLLLMDRTEAQFTEYLSKLSEEFGNKGSFSEISNEKFHSDKIELAKGLTIIANNIKSRYNQLGMDVSVKDLSYYFDWNKDGIAGNEIADASSPVTLEVNDLSVPTEGGIFNIKINSTVPLTLNPEVNEYLQENPPHYDIDNGLYILHSDYRDTLSFTKELNGLTLSIHVNPATSRKIEPTMVHIYNYLGDIVASLTIKQEGNPEGLIFADYFNNYLNAVCLRLSKSIDLYQAMDSWYTNLTINSNFRAPLSSSNYYISNLWTDFYTSININNTIRKQLNDILIEEPSIADDIEKFLISLKTLNALTYYYMVTLWGDIPFITQPLDFSNYDGSLEPRNKVDEIFKSLEGDLIIASLELEDKKNSFISYDVENFILFSKDVPRIVLAWIYMYQGNYIDAQILLKYVEEGGNYHLESGNDYSLSSSELIYGLRVNDGIKNSSNVPILIYTDVILSLAECELKLGNNASAQEYLKRIAKVKDISVGQDIIVGIKEVLKQVSNRNYFTFLKRNNLALTEIGLHEFQLLFPIPERETFINPNLIQNQGY